MERKSTIVINDFSVRNPRISHLLEMQEADLRAQRVASLVHAAGRTVDFLLQTLGLALLAAAAVPVLQAFFWLALVVT